MTITAPPCPTGPLRGLRWLIKELDARADTVDAATAQRLLADANLTEQDVAPYVERRLDAYARRCVVHRESYELLVLTWGPGQGSAAHDHAGSLCGLKVVQGSLTEQLYAPGPDGQVRPTTATRFAAGQIIIDPGAVVHALTNTGTPGQLLVTVHLYSPPLPAIRRYAIASSPAAPLFLREASPKARVIAILGGGFTGTMTLANLLRLGRDAPAPLHFVMIDRQPAVGEGVAYRTGDARHLLNVPAGKMSAWPDRPDDFLAFARACDPSVGPGDFLPRRLFGQYVRKTLLDLAGAPDGRVSVELIRDEATSLAPASSAPGWSVTTAAGRELHADLAVVTLGHRPPNDELAHRFKGPRNRFVADPWSTLVLSQIGPDEPVLLLGSGLTAVDAILTLDRADRTAPLTVVSRRGLVPLPHTREPPATDDVSRLVAQWLDPSMPLTVRRLVRTLREAVASAAARGVDWRPVVDGLRPSIAKLWRRLDPAERARFLRHVRPFWEVHRHRMAPEVADRIGRLRDSKVLEVAAGTLLSSVADADGVDVTLRCRGGSATRSLRVAWVVNCTGPGVHDRRSTHPILRPLLEAGTLSADALGLGLCTDDKGRALTSGGETHPDLLVAGTLRKSTLWESTAVPELREQARVAAELALETVLGNRRAQGD